MNNPNNLIIDTAEVAEADWDGHGEPSELEADISATRQATGARMEFHVQMNGYTLAEMDNLIVEAAARQLVGRHGDRELSKAIEAKCIEQITSKVDKALAGVTAEIIEQPLTPSFGDKKPVTMREFIGLTGREYLTERVDHDGKPSPGGWGSNSYTRVELLVIRHVNKTFKAEIQKATNAAIGHIQAAYHEQFKSLIEEQKARIREAIAKASA